METVEPEPVVGKPVAGIAVPISFAYPYAYLIVAVDPEVCGTSGTQKSWVIIGPMLRAKPIPRV